ncbi:hypothetical protein BDC45DRAFT_561874 [Circinella umbellata]|nr:hypothetical protein BDC45DRAFT_561874 [Circinella umbellata]
MKSNLLLHTLQNRIYLWQQDIAGGVAVTYQGDPRSHDDRNGIIWHCKLSSSKGSSSMESSQKYHNVVIYGVLASEVRMREGCLDFSYIIFVFGCLWCLCLSLFVFVCLCLSLFVFGCL